MYFLWLMSLSMLMCFAAITNAQIVSECNVEGLEVFLNDPDMTGTNVRETPGGKVTRVIKNDPQQEIYLSFKVCKMEGDWLCVKGGFHKIKVEGWIHNSVVTTKIAAYTPQEPKLIFDNADASKKIVDKVSVERSVKILAIHGLYSKIEYQNSNDEKIRGYISNYDLCGNPYSNCN